MTPATIRVEIEPNMTGPTTMRRQAGWTVVSIYTVTETVKARHWFKTRRGAERYAAYLRNDSTKGTSR